MLAAPPQRIDRVGTVQLAGLRLDALPHFYGVAPMLGALAVVAHTHHLPQLCYRRERMVLLLRFGASLGVAFRCRPFLFL